MRILLASTLLLVLNPPPQAPTATYRDPALNLTFTYPADFVDASVATPPAPASTGHAGGSTSATACLSTPLFATRSAGKDQEEMLTLNRVDVGCMGAKPTPAFLLTTARNSLEAALKSAGTPTLLPPATYQLDGHDAVFIQGSTPAAKDTDALYGGVACILIQNPVHSIVLCSAALTAFPSHLPPLFATPVTVAGRPPVPFVPANKVVQPAGPDPKSSPAATS